MKKVVAVLVLVTAAAMIAGCARTSAAGDETATTSTAPARASKRITLPGDDWGYPSPFAFYSRGPGYVRMSLLFDTLTWKDEEGVIPWLAEDWTVSADGTEWTFKLRPDVRWHDGEPLTAEDVAFTFQYFKEHRGALTWSWPVDRVEGSEAADAETVVLRLVSPMAGAHESLIGSLPIIPRHVWEGVEDPARITSEAAVVGSGPFELIEYSKAEGRYVYDANRDYFRGPPTVDGLTFIKVENEALALKTGTTDYASFWGKEIEAVRQFEGDEAYGVIDGPSFWVLKMIFNTQRAPFDDVVLRRAVAHAVDRQRLVDQVAHGGATVANPGIVSPFTDWKNPNLVEYEHDPQKARAMLAEASGGEAHAEGFSLTLITTAGFAREAELLQADLEAIGMEVAVRTGDYSTIDGLLREGSFDLAVSGHGGIANPSMLETPTWPAAAYNNAAYDALYREQAAEVNEEARREMVWRLQEIVIEDLPVLTLYHPKMWTVYDASALNTWFYTRDGIGFGIPISLNKLIFLP